MSISTADTNRLSAGFTTVLKSHRRASLAPLGLIALALIYLIYAWFSFDMGKVFGSADADRSLILSRDSFHYKYQIEHSQRRDALSITVEGNRDTESAKGEDWEGPAWISRQGNVTRVDLGDGHVALFGKGFLDYTAPDGAVYEVRTTDEGVTVNGYRSILVDDRYYRFLPVGADPAAGLLTLAELEDLGIVPQGASFATTKFEYAPDFYKRIRATRSQILAERYFFGWEFFWFGPKSPLAGKGLGEVWDIAMSDERITPELANHEYIFLQFWRNPDWQHNEMFIALLETLLMALLGTFVAAGVGLPLGFLAAANFNPFFAGRMALRRLFDFLRGIDQIIWSLIFIRAFGLGPLTGSMAIAFTDTGTLGKLFSEAIENIDNKQVEGVRSTGATASQRYRFGVIPQILPVFVSQTLYYLESNIRSATVIGALGAGGIGLKLVQAMQTHKDWENVMYLITMTLIVVITMDIASGWLRRKLTGAEASRN
ncbi:MAG: phosphonate ABC transporter, permease protein PhnE [Alphaproteobacteria bacterium]|nr:phosphonate ABC transporter, permease protein PhnE [Alphaproteobacteria bacterium]